MTIEVLGGGCPKCKVLAANAEAALASKKVEAEVVKVTEMEKILEKGVMSTPALVIDGKVVASGRVLSAEEISSLL